MTVKLRDPDASLLDLTPDQPYVVLGIEAEDLRILNDQGRPYLYPADLFEGAQRICRGSPNGAGRPTDRVCSDDGPTGPFLRSRIIPRSARLNAMLRAKETVRTLPDDCRLEDVLYQLYVIQSVERGREDARAGRVTPHDQVATDLRQRWQTGHGRYSID